jgi:hypothetical protein
VNKETKLRDLADTENRAALGDRQIAYQRARIERLGRGLREAKALLAALEDCQRVNLENRGRMITELWTPPYLNVSSA